MMPSATRARREKMPEQMATRRRVKNISVIVESPIKRSRGQWEWEWEPPVNKGLEGRL